MKSFLIVEITVLYFIAICQPLLGFTHHRSAFLSKLSMHRKLFNRFPIKSDQTNSLSNILKQNNVQTPKIPKLGEGTKFIFIGGKGGVGKTSTSAALAVACSDANLRTLVVSTDPAHSLGDALYMKLSGTPRLVENNLEAVEIDAFSALERLRKKILSLNLTQYATGIPSVGILSKLSMNSVSELLQKPPPGFDELLALSEVISTAKSGKYDRVIIDTAPTGHTLRLLGTPQFLDLFLDNIVQLKNKISGLLLVGNGIFEMDVEGIAMQLDRAEDILEAYREDMLDLNVMLKNPNMTQFIVISSPCSLAITETKSLIQSLNKSGVHVNSIIMNKVLAKDKSSDEVIINGVIKSNEAALQRIRNGTLSELTLTEVPLFSSDMRGIEGVSKLSNILTESHEWSTDISHAKKSKQRLILVGGKGGVGKTTSAAALALACARKGLSTLVLSTDPAHSLGDAFEQNLSSTVQQIKAFPQGNLYGLEIDTEKTSNVFKDMIESASSSGLNFNKHFNKIFEYAPPGLSEMIAIGQVLTLINEKDEKSGQHKYDRVIIDTAPTGHTLRLLGTPQFLDLFLDKLIDVRNGVRGVMKRIGNMFGSSSESDKIEENRDKLRDLQVKMYALEDLLTNHHITQFVVVSIPTQFSILESERLVKALKEQNIHVRHLILNQMVKQSNETDKFESFLNGIRTNQRLYLNDIEKFIREHRTPISVTQVPWLKEEAIGVTNLRDFAELILIGEKVCQ